MDLLEIQKRKQRIPPRKGVKRPLRSSNVYLFVKGLWSPCNKGELKEHRNVRNALLPAFAAPVLWVPIGKNVPGSWKRNNAANMVVFWEGLLNTKCEGLFVVCPVRCAVGSVLQSFLGCLHGVVSLRMHLSETSGRVVCVRMRLVVRTRSLENIHGSFS